MRAPKPRRAKVKPVEPRQLRRDHQYYEDLVGAVALGAATPEERQALLTHASECPICRPELAELRAAVTALPLMLEEREPSPILRYRIQAIVQHELTTGVPIEEPALGSVDDDPEEDTDASPFVFAVPVAEPAPVPIRPRRPRAIAIWAAAAIFLLAVSAGLVLWNLLLLQDQRDVGEEETIAVNVAVASPPANLAADLTYLQDRGVFLLSVRDLPALTENEIFQVWLIGDDPAPISVGTFRSETAEVAVAADRAEFAALAVSVEPGPTGSPAPTTTPILVANLSDEAAAGAWSQSPTATREADERTTKAAADDGARADSRAEETDARGERAEQGRADPDTRANANSDPAGASASSSGSSTGSGTSGGASESDASGGNSGGGDSGGGTIGDGTSGGAAGSDPDGAASGGGGGASGGSAPSGGVEPVVNEVEDTVEEAVQVPRVVLTTVPVEVPVQIPTDLPVELPELIPTLPI